VGEGGDVEEVGVAVLGDGGGVGVRDEAFGGLGFGQCGFGVEEGLQPGRV
jgi:hypothetical protein